MITTAKKFPKLLIAGIAAVFIVVATGIIKSQSIIVGQLEVTEEFATVVRNNKETTIQDKTELQDGDLVKISPYGRAQIHLKDSTIIRLESGTELVINDVSYSGNRIKNALFTLIQGKAWSLIGSVTEEGKFSIQTDTAIASTNGGSFNAYRRLYRTSEFYTNKNTLIVSLKDHDQEKTISQGQFMILFDRDLQNSFNIGSSLAPDEYINGWIRTNLEYDQELCDTNPNIPACDPNSYTPIPTIEPTPVPSLSQPLEPDKTQSTANLVELTLTADPNSAPGQKAVVKVIAKFADGTFEDVTNMVAWQQEPILGEFTQDRFVPKKTGTVKIKAYMRDRVSNEVEIVVHPLE